MVTLIILFCTMICGFILRKVRVPHIPDKLMTYLVWALVFLFGVSIGGDKEVVTRLHGFGLTAFIVAVFSVVGSVFGAWLLWRFKKRT